jgi:HEAT repeat protein
MKLGEIDKLGREFVNAVVASRQANGVGDIPAHNRWMRRGDRAAQKLIDRGENGKDALEALLGHEEPSVRLGAASYVLKWAPDRAIPVLEDLLIWAKQDRSRDIFGEPFLVIQNVHGLLAQHYGISFRDVDARVFGSRGLPLS